MTTERLGKYEIRGTLGKGAMGTVYAAWDPIISRQVAIKTVRLPDAADIDAQEELARFKREAQAAGRLTHPNIVGIFDYGESDEVAYIVMEFVDGRTLKSVLDGEERMQVATVGKIMADLLAGLAYSHERGVVHRDIKPANVMIVGGDGHGSGQAKIADFGIARIESSNLTQAGTIMGTPAYMSPEQFMGQTVDARTDIYSSGVLLFQLLTGERPFEGSMATIMHKALNTQPPKPSELSVTAPVALDAVVSRAMARRPDDRFPSAAAFAEAIVAALEARPPVPRALDEGLGDLDSESTVVRPAGRPATPTATAKAAPAKPAADPARARSKAPLLAGVAVLVLAAGGAGAAWWAGLFGGSEPANAQIGQDIGTSTRTTPGTVTAANTPQGPVVAVAPPSTTPPSTETAAATQPQATPTTPTLPSTTPATPAAPTAPVSTTPATPPPPRTDVTQVVPPTTSGGRTGAPATTPTQIIPPTPPPTETANTTPPRRDLSRAPPLEQAHVAAPNAATVPPPATVPSTPEPRPATRPARPAPGSDTAANTTRLEPAIVPPPTVVPVTNGPTGTAPSTIPATTPDSRGPAATAANNFSPPVTPAPPPPARTAEPNTVSPPTPQPAVIPPETQSQPPVVTAAVVTPEALRRAVTSAVQGADCAVLQGDLSRAGTISLQGVIGSGAPTQALLREIRDAAPTAPLDWAAEEATGPYCGALNLVRAYARPFGRTAGGLDVGLKDGRTHLLADDRIDIQATLPAFPAYLQVDYLSSDGSVLHVQTAAQGSQLLPAHSSQSYVPGAVAPPFGTDLIIAIASSVPLFNKGQTLADDAEPYLRQLRSAVEAAAKRRAELASGVVVVHTSPKS